jgi:putative ABC transport system permease protein
MSARRVLVRWSWRLFRREWRQQVLVVALLTLAVAGTVIGLGIVTNATTALDPVMGNAGAVLNLAGSDPTLAADVAQVRHAVGRNEVIENQHFNIPGSVQAGDLRAQDPNGVYSRPLLRLVSGRYPTAPDDIAVTSAIAADFDLHVGSVWRVAGRPRTVVGMVENPLNLTDQFALVPPGQVAHPDKVQILSDANRATIERLHVNDLGVALRGNDRAANRALAMLVLSTIALLFVGLLAAAGFTVMAQRRMRALGMLGAVGATDRQVRLVMIANGAASGAVAAVIGAVSGIAVWFAFAPRLSSIAAHRVSRFALPWWAVGTAMGLAFLTALLAAWWPAHSATHVPVVAALSGRPPRPQPARRFAALGVLLLAVGVGGLALAREGRTGYIITGIIATSVGVLLLAPIATTAVAFAAGRTRVSVRIALRDLARYQARSGAAAAAICLAIGVASTIAIVSAADAAGATRQPNLQSNQLVVYLSADGPGSPVPQESAAQLQTAQASVTQLATMLHASSLELDEAVDPTSPVIPVRGGGAGGQGSAALVKPMNGPDGRSGWQFVAPLYVATPAVLVHYRVGPVEPTADLLSSRTDLAGLQILTGAGKEKSPVNPVVQHADLPRETSAPNTLLTESALSRLHLSAVPSAWLVTADHPLTKAEIREAERTAAGVGLVVESRSTNHGLGQLRTDATAIGVLVALGVLAMTVGLIRSEAANELRTLAATGASSSVRRAITGATAGALALVGAVLGVAGAYVALLAWYHRKLTPLGHVPFADLAVILIALPVAATAGSWLLAGREPPALARSPLD